MAHATNPEAVKNAIRLGAHSVEHGYIMDDECIALLLEHDTWYVRVSWLGWVGIALVCAFFIAVAVIIGRELAGLFRLKQLARLRLQGDEAAVRNDRDAAVRMLRSLITLYGDRSDTARGRRLVAAHLGEIIDGRDLLVLAERDLIAPLDKRAKLLASAAARGSRW
jgi:putative membrane protein